MKQFATNPLWKCLIEKNHLEHGWKCRSSVDKKAMEHAVSDLQKLQVKKPVVTVARKSIGFKIRDISLSGLQSNLRRERMFEFLDRLQPSHVLCMRLPWCEWQNQLDGSGNQYVREQLFPEIEYDKIDVARFGTSPLPLLRKLTKKQKLCCHYSKSSA